MKKTIYLLLASCLCCGDSMDEWDPKLYVEGIPVVTDVTEEEVSELTVLGKAVRKVFGDVEMPKVLFVREPDQKVPEICKGPGCSGECADRWNEYPDVMDPEPRVAGEGYSGLQHGDYVFISRIGDRVTKLRSLLIHEFTHWICDCGHGDMFDVTEKALKEGYQEGE